MKNYIFDKEKIEGLLSDFYVGTSIAVALYDAEMNMVATSPVYSEYCARVRDIPEGRRGCDECDRIHMQRAKESGQAVFYACHAGLTETVTPIFYEGTLIAYMQTGQFRDAVGEFCQADAPCRLAVEHGIEPSFLSSLYAKTPLISEKKLAAHLNIADALVKSFWVEGLISRNRSMLSVKIEQYIDEHLTEKIHIDGLCKEFYLSKNALYALFRDEFHTTVGDFIAEKRLHLAQHYLQTKTEINISQIASLCGFPDYNYFIRLFKKRLGMTPLQFRKRSLLHRE
ncbi:MAG: PocR ligand-binding domain-containing protein [Clostridia bacterium]|nr:PocR ligand-binding domain-containing protein [Clostridia bacterium]